MSWHGPGSATGKIRWSHAAAKSASRRLVDLAVRMDDLAGDALLVHLREADRRVRRAVLAAGADEVTPVEPLEQGG